MSSSRASRLIRAWAVFLAGRGERGGARRRRVTGERRGAAGAWACRRRCPAQVFEAGVAAAAEAIAVVALGLLLVEVLVIFLGGVEGASGGDLGDDGAGQALGGLDGGLAGFGGFLLRGVEIEDAGAILRALVAELAGLIEGSMLCQKISSSLA